MILAALAALAGEGPGRFSLDESLGIGIRGPVVTAAAMLAGAVGALYVSERGQELFAVLDADDPLSRSEKPVGVKG